MDRSKVLVVDDEKHICQLIETYLVDEYNLTSVQDGQTAIEKLRDFQFDLVILDIMLPRVSGWDVCRYIRAQGDTPIIMLTAKGEDIDKVLGLELGADDYITKPFNPRELVARVKAVLRRFKIGKDDNVEIIEYPGISINNVSHQAKICGQQIDLTPKEFELLWLFASNPGIVFSREQLLQKVWGFNYLGDSRTIDSTVKRLRRKLEEVSDAAFFIQTVWGIGYKFEAPL